MEAKDKVKELLDKIDNALEYSTPKRFVKECALIFVDLMLEECEGYPKGIKYWQEVKQEINKL